MFTGRGLRRDIVDMNGTGVPIKERNAYVIKIEYVIKERDKDRRPSPPLEGDVRVRKPDGQLVLLGYGRYRPSTYSLSTWSSPTVL